MSNLNQTGYIDSVYCGSGVDGVGLRCVVFFSGCNLRCPFCHNPETLFKKGTGTIVEELMKRLVRYKGYFRRGGVTISGGEPFLQRDFYIALCDALRDSGIHICVETNGHILDSELISKADSIICDVKNQEEEELEVYENFFSECLKQGKVLRVTNVLVPQKNDSEEKIQHLAQMLKKCEAQGNFKFLPFRKLCQQKYAELGREFPYEDIPEAENDDIDRAYSIFQNECEK